MVCTPLALDAGAAGARQGLYDLDLFAVLFDQVAYVDGALEAGVRALLLFGRWVRLGCGRVIHVNSSILLAGLREILGGLSAGPFLCLRLILTPH
jgi:hypothetical protein